MGSAARRKTDEELNDLREARMLWIVRGRSGDFVTHAGSLHGALKKARAVRIEGGVVSSLQNESDGIVIENDQLSRLVSIDDFPVSPWLHGAAWMSAIRLQK